MRLLLAGLALLVLVAGASSVLGCSPGESMLESTARALWDATANLRPAPSSASPAEAEASPRPLAVEVTDAGDGEASVGRQTDPRSSTALQGAPGGKRVYYQFVEEGGVVRFVDSLDQVPAALRARAGRVEIEAPAPRRRAGLTGASRLAAREKRRSRSYGAASEPRVVVYSTSWCGWCRKTLAYLNERRVDYVNKDIEANPAHRQELIEKTGRTSIPVVEIDGHIVNGYDPRRLDRLLASPS